MTKDEFYVAFISQGIAVECADEQQWEPFCRTMQTHWPNLKATKRLDHKEYPFAVYYAKMICGWTGVNTNTFDQDPYKMPYEEWLGIMEDGPSDEEESPFSVMELLT